MKKSVKIQKDANKIQGSDNIQKQHLDLVSYSYSTRTDTQTLELDQKHTQYKNVSERRTN